VTVARECDNVAGASATMLARQGYSPRRHAPGRVPRRGGFYAVRVVPGRSTRELAARIGVKEAEARTCGVKKFDPAFLGRARWWPRPSRFRLRVVRMSLLYRFLLALLRLVVRAGGERELAIIVLRQQLAILRRGGKRPWYTTADRALLAAVSRLLPPERCSCFPVNALTLRRWHRALLQGEPRSGGRRVGRPPVPAGTRSLIERLARENPRWATCGSRVS
jgi:hypothetical protein